MTSSSDTQLPLLRTTVGDLPLGECRLAIGGREWSILYTSAIVSGEDESRYLTQRSESMPYGVVLWPAAIALAHEIAVRDSEFRGRSVLELGAGTGLPGIVAASIGARVAQTDRSELVLHLCRMNGSRNETHGVEYRLADWSDWHDDQQYDWIIGSDILYADSQHAAVQRIFECSLTPGGKILLADPFRADSLALLEALSTTGWAVTHSRWSIGEGSTARPVAVHELVPKCNNA